MWSVLPHHWHFQYYCTGADAYGPFCNLPGGAEYDPPLDIWCIPDPEPCSAYTFTSVVFMLWEIWSALSSVSLPFGMLHCVAHEPASHIKPHLKTPHLVRLDHIHCEVQLHLLQVILQWIQSPGRTAPNIQLITPALVACYISSRLKTARHLIES